MSLTDRKFWRHKRSYFFQCFLATITIVIVLLVLDSTEQTAIIVSIGATTFIVFTSPGSQPARTRSLIGGYSVGIACGIGSVLAGGLIDPLSAWGWLSSPVIMGGFAVGLSIFLMVLTDTEHPPASAIALGLVINEWDALSIVVICSAAGILTLMRHFFRNSLRNLV